MAVGYSLGSVLLAKYLGEADAGLHGDWGVDGGGGRNGAPAVAGGGWRQLSGSGLVAAALVSPPICLHSTNSRLARVGPDLVYNLALAYK